jgi:hypothetical protein
MRRCTRRAVNRLNLGSSARFRLLSSGSTHIADISQITLPGSATGPCAAIVQSPPPLCLFCIRGEYEDSTYLKTEILRFSTQRCAGFSTQRCAGFSTQRCAGFSTQRCAGFSTQRLHGGASLGSSFGGSSTCHPSFFEYLKVFGEFNQGYV